MDQNLLLNLQEEFKKTPQDLARIDTLLRTVMIQLSTLGIGGGKINPADKAQIQQVLEMGALWSIHSKNQSSFQRYVSLLCPIYFEASDSKAPENSPMYSILGLHLLSLLVSNRIAEFYVALERISTADKLDANNVFVQFPVQLQQCLVEGTFHRVVLARQQVPSPEYAWFIDCLMDTIRNELANCLEKSFKSVDLASAAKLLLLTPDQVPRLIKFAQQRGWIIENNSTIVFAPKAAPSNQVSTFCGELILQNLGYARELEQII